MYIFKFETNRKILTFDPRQICIRNERFKYNELLREEFDINPNSFLPFNKSSNKRSRIRE